MKPEELKKLPAIRGRDELIQYLRGGRITHKQAVLAKCYECMGYCADGKVDCEIADCPLYLFNPYRNHHNSINHLQCAGVSYGIDCCGVVLV